KLSINQSWQFHLGDPDAKFYEDPAAAKWEEVHVPHTFSLTSLALDGLQDEKTQLVFQRQVGWYRKRVNVNADPNKKVFLEFEGAHQITDLWVNGKHVGQHETGGYTPFHFDISDFVERGVPNQITLKLDNRRQEHVPPDPGPFDYVKFSGLYRDVYLIETDPMHITFNWEALHAGVNITTPTVDPVNMNATISIKTVVRNEYESPQPCQLITRIIDQNGLVVLKLEQEAEIGAGQDFEFDQIGSIEDNLHLWDTENPYLYRVNSQVVAQGKVLDCLENRLGVRKFYLDPVRGFVLNNKPIKLFGYNRHQHYGYIGDALPNSLHYKDMLQFKQLGFNIMRTAHYPQDDAIMEACDELGILVYEEAPSWISMSTDPRWWDNFEQAARVMVRNHRNHPSIVIWGGGINHRGYVARAHNTIKQEDPNRLTASQGARWTGWQTSGLTDINANMLYGPFIWDRSEPMFAMEGRNGPEEIAKYKRDQLMTGLISWTAHAYYTFHPTHDKANDPIDRTRSGEMTVFRYPRPGLMWYPSEYKEEPFVWIEEAWDPSVERLTVYSNGDEVELSVNGKVIARQGPSQDSIYAGLEHAPIIFEIDNFEAGTLTAQAFSAGVKIAETSIQTPKKAWGIRLELDTLGRDLVADGSDIVVAYAHVVDKNGTTIRDAELKVEFSVEGPASIVGDGVDINANPMFTEYGVAPVLLRAGTEAGEITLKAKAPKLKAATATLNSIAYNPDYIASRAQPIYDFAKLRVDIGSPEQLVQFGWPAWYGTAKQTQEYKSEALGGFTANISTSSEAGILRWLGEMNVIGKYGYVYGDGLIGIDDEGLVLTFRDLAAGKYKLTTWHHAPRSNSDLMDPNRAKLEKLQIHKIPFERKICLFVEGETPSENDWVELTEGKNMQFDTAATYELVFESDGVNPVKIRLKGEGNKGIWLNAFELSQWDW
ncbi:MAG: glycoside hydrolase family 2 TIM barrel-domain containing protein, partial [Bacteroidota bacterium]